MSTQTLPARRRWFSKAWLMEQKSLIALIVLIAVVASQSPNFFTVNNLFNILQQTSVNAIMAVGMTLVLTGRWVGVELIQLTQNAFAMMSRVGS